MNTICAHKYCARRGGIAVIRVSGDQAFDVCDRLFDGKTTTSARYVAQGLIWSNQRWDKILDEVLATPFQGPHSFTGEDTVEIAWPWFSFYSAAHTRTFDTFWSFYGSAWRVYAACLYEW